MNANPREQNFQIVDLDNFIENDKKIDTSKYYNIENEIVDTKSKISEPKIVQILDPEQYIKNPDIVFSMKIPDLRATLKHYKQNISFHITSAYTNDLEHYSTADVRIMKQNIKALYNFALVGTKRVLVERVQYFFEMWVAALRIQTRFRGNMVRVSQLLRGPGLRNRKLCVNETDFYTLEPLDEIATLDFFSYKTKDNFVYGFDLNSIRAQLKSSKKFNNPYTREPMVDILPRIRKLGRISKMLSKNIYGNSTIEIPETVTPLIRNGVPTLANLIERSIQSTQNVIIRQNVSMYLPAEYNQDEMLAKLREIRSKPFEERVHALFMEIDHLGHYTQAQWFLELNTREYIRLYRSLHDIWRYQAGLSFTVKVSICPLWDPFIIQSIENIYQSEHDVSKTTCLTVMEEMIYTGINDEYRMLGAFHCLASLTIVSLPARNSMMWLYESIR